MLIISIKYAFMFCIPNQYPNRFSLFQGSSINTMTSNTISVVVGTTYTEQYSKGYEVPFLNVFGKLYIYTWAAYLIK